jgi:FixJ family two-component response regulator
MQTEPTVFVVDDDEAVRNSLRWLIESSGHRVEAYESGQAFLDAYGQGRPGCLVLDVRMPQMGGLDLQKKLTEYNAYLPIIFISGHATVPIAVRAMRLGAVDFFTKPFNNQALLDRLDQCIRQCADMWKEKAQRHEIAVRLQTLTPRESEVMKLVTAGHANKMIAAELSISIKTVEAHRARVMEKMGADSLAELMHMLLDGNQPRVNPDHP